MKYEKLGLTYQGSKNKLIPRLIPALPSARHFYDLFGGGGAVSHGAVLSGKWQFVHYNELNPLVFNAVKNSITGEYDKKQQWVSRQKFELVKAIDPYAAFCFSFGSNLRCYAYSPGVEQWQKAFFHAREYNDFTLFKEIGIDTDGTRQDLLKNFNKYKAILIEWYVREYIGAEVSYQELIADLKSKLAKDKDKLFNYLKTALKQSGLSQKAVNKHLNTQMAGHYFGKSQWVFPTREHYAKLQEILPLPLSYDELMGYTQITSLKGKVQDAGAVLESLENLAAINSLDNMTAHNQLKSMRAMSGLPFNLTNKDYQEVKIEPNSVIYCDIPYKDTDNKAYRAIGAFDHNRFYDWALKQNAPIFISEYAMPSEFVSVCEYRFRCDFSTTGSNKVTEKLFMPRWQFEKIGAKQKRIISLKVLKQEDALLKQRRRQVGRERT